MAISALCCSVARKVASYPGRSIASALGLVPLSGSCVCAYVYHFDFLDGLSDTPTDRLLLELGQLDSFK